MRLVFDIETNGLDFSTGNWLPDVHTVFCLVIQDVDTNKIERYYDTDGPRELGTASIEYGIKKLEEADELIGHNIIQFDVPVLRKLYGFESKCRIYDTLVASRTLFPDRTGGHSLGAWGSRLGFAKTDFDDFTKFSHEMLDYCTRDVGLNLRVYKALKQEEQQGNWGEALDLEHKIAQIISDQERIGFFFNSSAAKNYLEDWNDRLTDIDTTVLDRVPGVCKPGVSVSKPFKINGEPAKRTLDILAKYNTSPDNLVGPFQVFDYSSRSLESKEQQKKLLLELGWKPENLTPAGNPKLDASITQVGEIGELLLERNVLSHRRSQVQGLLDMTDNTSRVHGGANPCGTNTGRMKHMRIVNIPRASSPYGKEIRALFAVPPGRTLVGYDAASLELRILAHYIGNEDYNESICSSDKNNDAHTLAARAAGSDDRELGKTINYALIYGAGDRKLGSIIGQDEAAGLKLRMELYNRIPGLERLVTRAKSASKKGYLTTLDGRRLYLRQRVSPLNTLIQGGGAVFMKTVAAHLDHLAFGLDAVKVVDMHDEAQWECHPDAVEALSSHIHEAFDYACSHLNLRCPQEAEIKVGQNWMETH